MKFIPSISIKNWFKYAKNFSLNKFTPKSIPYSAQIEITLKCNASCAFCTIPNISPTLIQNEMTTDQIKNIINQIADLGVNVLTFTGGEPTLRKDLPELINYAGKEHGIIVGIATNGYLMPKLFKENDNLEGLNYILISIDYPQADLHNQKRGINVFDKALETIQIAESRGIHAIVNTVVMKDNFQSIEKLCELTDNLDIPIEIYPCQDIVRKFNGKRYYIKNIENMIPNLSEWAHLIRYLRGKYKNILTDPVSINLIEKGGFGGYPNYYQNFLRCHVSEAYLFIRWDGFIDFPCKINPLVSFNALKYPISAIYHVAEIKNIMQCRDDFEFCNGCYFGCAIVSSLPFKLKALYYKYIQGYLSGNLK